MRGENGYKNVVYDEFTTTRLIETEIRKYRVFAKELFPPSLEFVVESYVIQEFEAQIDDFLDDQKQKADPELWEKRKSIIGDRFGSNREDEKVIEFWYARFEEMMSSIHQTEEETFKPIVLIDGPKIMGLFKLLIYS